MKSMVQLRKEIDAIDKRILELLAERLELVKKVAKEKQKARLLLVDREREEQLKEMWETRAKELGIDIKPISRILKELLNMSKETQSKVTK